MGKKCHQKCRMSPLLPVFSQKSHPWCHVCLVKNERPECEIKAPLGYDSFSILYMEIILEATISRVFSYPPVGVIFEEYI